jgi:putative transposase
MLSVGVQHIAAILSVNVQTARNWTERPDWPKPTLSAVHGTGRPEKQWLIKDLPVSITIKGRAVLIRARVMDALASQLLATTPEGKTHETSTVRSQNTLVVSAKTQGGANQAGLSRGVVQGLNRHGKTAAPDADGGQGVVRDERGVSGEEQSAQSVQLRSQSTTVVCEKQRNNSPALPSRSASTALALGSTTPAIRSTPSAGDLNDTQRRTAEARAALLREVERMTPVIGQEKAIQKLIIMAMDGTLAPHLLTLVPVANAKAGTDGKRTLSRRTLFKWMHDLKEANGKINALAPKGGNREIVIPDWAPALLAVYQQPQKPSLRWAVEQIAPMYPQIDAENLYDRAGRFLKKMGNVELQAGRMGSRELKNIKPFHRRDTSVLWPGDVYTADGHCFDAEIAHPAHGKPFRPEITNILDVATRRAVGWSIDLAESGLAVLDALRFACESCGIPNLFYVDNGSGYKNALMSAAGVGMEARVGFTMTHALPYNSQAKGLMERSHLTIFVRAAKELPTYIGASMDAQAKQIVHKLTRKDVKAGVKSKYLMGFDEFVRFIADKIADYNARPHSSLPKIYDPVRGKKRHMSPDEAWAQGIKDGAAMVTISPEESRDLFRPQKECKIIRGEIRLFGNLYFSETLKEFHGDVLRVAYDVRDPATVWVHNSDGRFICNAQLNGNKDAYFAESVVEQAAVKRAKGREKRLLNNLEEVQAELEGARKPMTLENQPSKTLPRTGLELEPADFLPKLTLVTEAQYEVEAPAPMAMMAMPEPETAPEVTPTPAPAPKRPMFDVESEHYEWLMTHKDQWTQHDARFLQRYLNEDDGYALLSERFELLEMAWGEREQQQLQHLLQEGNDDFLTNTSGQKTRLASA